MRIAGLGLLGLLLACGPRSSERAGQDAAPDEPRTSEEQRVRVLITGFNDWHDIRDQAELWRCRDNPSCRLLIGDAATGEPRGFAGPLVTRLEQAAPTIAWTFRTMPVTWGVFSRVPDEYDVIINVGLGIYDRFDAIQIERGAYNLHQGEDAAGVEAEGPIDPAKPEVVLPSDAVLAKIDALAGREIAGFDVLVAAARPDNSYLCNETHWFALAAQAAAAREVYFVHIPQPGPDGFDPLAEALAGVILELVDAGRSQGSG